MGMYCLNLLQIALELAIEDPAYDTMAAKFLEHFIFIADAMNSIDAEKEGLWNEEEGFYNGRLILPDGREFKMTPITFVGVIPTYAVATSVPSAQHPFPEYRKRFQWFMDNRPELVANIVEDVGKGADERILHWKDYILFHEYFHGDNGAGLGASAQTGWTGLAAKMILQYCEYVQGHKSPEQIEQKKLGMH